MRTLRARRKAHLVEAQQIDNNEHLFLKLGVSVSLLRTKTLKLYATIHPTHSHFSHTPSFSTRCLYSTSGQPLPTTLAMLTSNTLLIPSNIDIVSQEFSDIQLTTKTLYIPFLQELVASFCLFLFSRQSLVRLSATKYI